MDNSFTNVLKEFHILFPFTLSSPDYEDTVVPALNCVFSLVAAMYTR